VSSETLKNVFLSGMRIQKTMRDRQKNTDDALYRLRDAFMVLYLDSLKFEEMETSRKKAREIASEIGWWIIDQGIKDAEEGKIHFFRHGKEEQ